jgi:hypothetical protein
LDGGAYFLNLGGIVPTGKTMWFGANYNRPPRYDIVANFANGGNLRLNRVVLKDIDLRGVLFRDDLSPCEHVTTLYGGVGGWIVVSFVGPK